MSKIITIGRQFGSGGRELGKRLAEAMGIGYFDREVISEISRKSGLAETYVNNFVEKRVSYYPITVGRTFHNPITLQMDTEVYRAQSAAIRELAERGDCVIIGRCADYILEDMHPVNLFVFSDMDSRIARCRRKAPADEHLTDNELRKKILAVDKSRAKYYEFYTGQTWGKMQHYHLCINTAGREIKKLIPAVRAFVEA
jgi:cytidylate kinase